MNPCKIKKGIFVQRECNKPTLYLCKKCHLNVCENHSKILATERFCYSCYQSETNEEDDFSSTTVGSDYYGWYWGTRSRYYHSYGAYTVFDEHDYNGFNRIQTDDYDTDNDVDDFFDS